MHRVRLHETAKYHYDCGRQDRTNKYPDDRQVPLSPTCTTTPRSHVNDYMDTTSSSPKRVPLPTTLDIYETNVCNYRRRVQRLPLRRVRLLPTTTRERLPPLRPVNVYFHLHRIELEPPRNARFKGITAENDRRGTNACVLYEMPAFAPCPKLSRACFSSLPCHHLVGTRYPGSPHLLSHVTLSSLFLLHRYLHELSEPECCRGIIFLIFVVAPFSFRHGDQMLHNMLMSTFS